MDTRAYLAWCIRTHQARKAMCRKIMERVAYIGAMVLMAALWIAGWMIR